MILEKVNASAVVLIWNLETICTIPKLHIMNMTGLQITNKWRLKRF